MKFKIVSLLTAVMMVASLSCSKDENKNALDDFDPSKVTEEDLERMDREYEKATGISAHIGATVGTCRYTRCPVFMLVDKETQTLTLYLDGQKTDAWPVSTGKRGNATPDISKNPTTRIYEDYYDSHEYPSNGRGGYTDENGKYLGNMPYAFFIKGGYAIHGTASIDKLGKVASHGCVRIHPHTAKYLNRLVRKHGIGNVWVTIK